MKIGFFDSGLGGLTILASVRKLLPHYDYVFYGDTAHVPYGDRSEAEIQVLTQNAVEFLFDKECALVIVACNTASAETVRILQDTMLIDAYANRKLLGVVIPTVEEIETSQAQRVLFVGTTRTIESRKYEEELIKRVASIEIDAVATPELVPLIESSDLDHAYEIIDTVIQPRIGKVDAIVLGCTHYTMLKEHIREKFNVRVISQDEIIPEKLKNYLERHPEIESELTRGNSLEIILSKENEHYAKIRQTLVTV